MQDTDKVKDVTLKMINDLIKVHIQVTQLCTQLAKQTHINEVSKTMHTTVLHYQSTIADLQKLVNFIENMPGSETITND